MEVIIKINPYKEGIRRGQQKLSNYKSVIRIYKSVLYMPRLAQIWHIPTPAAYLKLGITNIG